MKNKGVTLIALVITIIVMLILAGVTISMIIGDNGIFTNAMQSEKEFSKAEIEEALDLLVNTKFMEAYETVRTDGLETSISDYFNESSMLTYFTGGSGTTYITADESFGYIETDVSGGATKIYKRYIISTTTVSSSVTKYGVGSISEGDVFTLEVVLDSGDNTKSSGQYELKYYDKGVTDSADAEVLSTIELYSSTSST